MLQDQPQFGVIMERNQHQRSITYGDNLQQTHENESKLKNKRILADKDI